MDGGVNRATLTYVQLFSEGSPADGTNAALKNEEDSARPLAARITGYLSIVSMRKGQDHYWPPALVGASTSAGSSNRNRRKQQGEKIEAPKEREPAKVVNLMEALRRSIQAEGGGKAKPGAASVQHRGGAKKKATRSSARQRRAS